MPEKQTREERLQAFNEIYGCEESPWIGSATGRFSSPAPNFNFKESPTGGIVSKYEPNWQQLPSEDETWRNFRKAFGPGMLSAGLEEACRLYNEEHKDDNL